MTLAFLPLKKKNCLLGQQNLEEKKIWFWAKDYWGGGMGRWRSRRKETQGARKEGRDMEGGSRESS